MRPLILHVIVIGIAALFSFGARAQTIPAGSYRDSCRNMRVPAAGLLAAECRDTEGIWKSSFLAFSSCRGDIYNNNGVLACAPLGSLPGGSWSDSCRKGYRRGSSLYAQCRTVAGTWRDASL